MEDRLRVIREAITKIEAITKNMQFEQFVADRTRRLAAERLLEIICEASR